MTVPLSPSCPFSLPPLLFRSDPYLYNRNCVNSHFAGTFLVCQPPRPSLFSARQASLCPGQLTSVRAPCCPQGHGRPGEGWPEERGWVPRTAALLDFLRDTASAGRPCPIPSPPQAALSWLPPALLALGWEPLFKATAPRGLILLCGAHLSMEPLLQRALS